MTRAAETRQPDVTVEQLQPDRFEDFYRARWPEIYRTLAVVLRNADLAQEATDEAMTRCYQRWRTVRRYRNPSGWVYRVALNWARSRLRKTARVVHGVGDRPGAAELPVPDPQLDRAVAALPLHHREVIVLRYLCDYSQAQVAEMLDIPEGTVTSRSNRALASLREEISDDA